MLRKLQAGVLKPPELARGAAACGPSELAAAQLISFHSTSKVHMHMHVHVHMHMHMHMHVHMHVHMHMHTHMHIYIYIHTCFRFTSKGLIGECGQRGGYLEMVGFSDATRAQFTKVVATPHSSGMYSPWLWLCLLWPCILWLCLLWLYDLLTMAMPTLATFAPLRWPPPPSALVLLWYHRPVFRRHDGKRPQGGRAILRALRAGVP